MEQSRRYSSTEHVADEVYVSKVGEATQVLGNRLCQLAVCDGQSTEVGFH